MQNSNPPSPTDIQAKRALEEILALRQLTKTTGTQTTRTQNRILRSLSEPAITRVALLLKALEEAAEGDQQ